MLLLLSQASKHRGSDVQKMWKKVSAMELKKHLCLKCWKKRYADLRAFYGEYYKLLADSLRNKGLLVGEFSTSYVNDFGKPTVSVIYGNTQCIPLREDIYGNYGGDEYAIYTVEVRDAIFGLPDNGIRLRYLKASNDDEFMDAAHFLERGDILAIASDGEDLFVLNDTGWVFSTKANWQKYQLFDAVEEIRKITLRYIDEKQISAEVALYGNGEKEASFRHEITYDFRQKAFFSYSDEGSSHDGVDRYFFEISREDALKQFTTFHFCLRELWDSARDGMIPEIVIVASLPIHEEGVKIQVPKPYCVY